MKSIWQRGINFYIVIFLLVGCSSRQKAEDAASQPEASSEVKVVPEIQKTLGEELTGESKSKDKSSVGAGTIVTYAKPDGTVAAPAATPEVASESPVAAKNPHPAAGIHRAEGGVAPDKALGWLKNGNTRFTKGFYRKDGATTKDRVRLSSGQKPHAVVLSCSDSRVPPEIVFDQKLGEIFVVRAAGEALDFATIASIEYAIAHLGANLLVVLGHESCGAVKAALEAPEGGGATPSLAGLVADLKPRLARFSPTKPSPMYVAEGWANTLGVAKDLLARSPIIRQAVADGSVMIKPALYHLGSGVVEWK